MWVPRSDCLLTLLMTVRDGKRPDVDSSSTDRGLPYLSSTFLTCLVASTTMGQVGAVGSFELWLSGLETSEGIFHCGTNQCARLGLKTKCRTKQFCEHTNHTH